MPEYLFKCVGNAAMHRGGCGAEQRVFFSLGHYEGEMLGAIPGDDFPPNEGDDNFNGKDRFVGVTCNECGWNCGSVRIVDPTSRMVDTTVRGTFGKRASKGLKGKSFDGAAERNRMMKAVGSAPYDDGETEGEFRSSTTQVYRMGENGVEQLAGPAPRTVKEKVAAYLKENPSAKATTIAEHLGKQPSSIYRAMRDLRAG